MKEYKDIQIKTFTVRVKHSRTKYDERKVNNFIKRVRVKQMNANFVQGDVPYYAYSFRYEEKENGDDE